MNLLLLGETFYIDLFWFFMKHKIMLLFTSDYTLDPAIMPYDAYNGTGTYVPVTRMTTLIYYPKINKEYSDTGKFDCIPSDEGNESTVVSLI